MIYKISDSFLIGRIASRVIELAFLLFIQINSKSGPVRTQISFHLIFGKEVLVGVADFRFHILSAPATN